MKKIFIGDTLTVGSDLTLRGDLYNHLVRSLRVKIDEKFIIGDNSKNEFVSTVKSITNRDIVLAIIDNYSRDNLLNMPNITLFFSILKGNNSDLVIQKCTEIGIDRFIPVVTKNSIIKIDEKNGKLKLSRWREIAKEASSQSNRLSIPYINPIISFEEVVKYSDNSSLKLFGKIDGEKFSFSDILKDSEKDILIFIGPEGDFSDYEIDSLEKLGFRGLSFHSNILRSETASIYICSSIFSFFAFGGN